MRETRLMGRVDKLPIRGPAVALQDAGVVGAEHARRLGKAAPGLDRVGGRVRRGKRPQPVRMAADSPPGFIGRDDRTAADGGAERVVGRLRLARRAMHRLDEAPARHRQAETIAQQVADAAEGEPALLVEDHGQRHRLRAELHGRRAERVRGLQRMPALHAAVTLPALADRHAKGMNDGALHREIFLVLRDDATVTHRPSTVRTLGGQRRLMPEVHVRRRPPMRLAAVGGAGLPPRSLGVCFRQAARKRRRLTGRPPARHLEFFFQPLVLAPQPVAFDLRALQVLFETLDAPGLIVDDLVGLSRRRIFRASGHAPVMPKPREKYKSNHVEYVV